MNCSPICRRGIHFFIRHEITRDCQKQRDGRIQQVPELHAEKIQDSPFHGGKVDAMQAYDHNDGDAPQKVEIGNALHHFSVLGFILANMAVIFEETETFSPDVNPK